MEWDRLAELFEEAASLGADERRGFLDELAHREPATAERIARLLARDETPHEYFRTGSGETTLEDHLFASLSGTRIGAFELGPVVAVGGMGAVYEAWQAEPRRLVALKIMRLGLGDPSARRRFRHESEILARLDHPGIAKVLAAGIHRDPERLGTVEVPWFAMEYVEGARPLLAFARDEDLDVEERVRLAVRICEAVQHAHQHGIVHRDLKSANVLVDPGGQPKVIDFGIARATGGPVEGVDVTRDGQLVGTPAAMSPEQLGGDPAAIDTRSDVYALGVVFYELLCGVPPFDLEGRTLHEVVRIVREEPPRPVDAALPTELGWILQRALEKEPGRRYPSASELGADLRRWLEDEPLEAGPPSRFYRVRKLARRHRVLVAAAALAVLSLAGGAAAASVGLLRARAANRELVVQRNEAIEARARAQDEARKAVAMSDFFGRIFRAAHPDRKGRDVRVVDVLEEASGGIAEQFAADPDLRVAFDRALGELFLGIGMPDQAAEHLVRATEEAVDIHGEHSFEAAEAKRLLGNVHLEAHDLPRAIELFESAREGMRRSAKTPRDLVVAETDLALALWSGGRIAEAEEILLSVVGRDDVQDLEDPQAPRSLLATLYLQSGRAELALPQLEEAVAWYRRNAPSKPQALAARHNLAAAYGRVGRDDEAFDLVEENVALHEVVYGPDHHRTVSVRHNLGSRLLAQERYDEAQEVFESVLSWRERELGPTHPRTLATMVQMSALHVGRGDAEGSERILARVVECARSSLGEGHPTLGEYMEYHASTLRSLGRLEEAEARLVEAEVVLAGSGTAGASRLAGVRRKLAELRAASAGHEK